MWNMGERRLSELIKSTCLRHHSESEMEKKRKKEVKLETRAGQFIRKPVHEMCVLLSKAMGSHGRAKSRGELTVR